MAGLKSASLLPSGIGAGLLFDDDADPTGVRDVDRGQTSPDTFAIHSANAAAVYLSLFNGRSPVGGTTPQDYQFPIPANGHKTLRFLEGALFNNRLSYRVTTGKGTTAAGAPATPPDVWALTSGGVLLAAAAAISGTIAETTPAGAVTTDIMPSLGAGWVADNDSDGTLRVFATAAKSIHSFYVDNRANAADSFLKLFDAAAIGALVLGTDDPDVIVRAPAGYLTRIVCLEGIEMTNGIVYGTTTSGGTGGTANPVGNADVRLLLV